MSEAVIQAVGLKKTYSEAANALCIFEALDFTLAAGESVGILGSSGAGKTTLLNILGGLDRPSAGDIRLCGVDLAKRPDKVMTRLRNQYLGFVYQFHHLLPEFTAMENVAMPLYIGGVSRNEAHERASKLLAEVGLESRLAHKPSELSGGERQRVAIARALVNNPRCVLMDEPTGNLDETTARKIQAVMLNLQQKWETAFVVVTHDRELAHKMDRVLMLEEGQLHPVSDT